MAAEHQPYDSDERDDLAALDFSRPDHGDDDAARVPMFTVTNPAGSVTVTTFMDGRVQQIELSSRTTDMTEPELADEIVVIAGLATQEAKSAQYSLMLEGMRDPGPRRRGDPRLSHPRPGSAIARGSQGGTSADLRDALRGDDD